MTWRGRGRCPSASLISGEDDSPLLDECGIINLILRQQLAKCTEGLLPGEEWEMGAFACLSALRPVVTEAPVLTHLLKLLFLLWSVGLVDASLMTFTGRCFGVLSLE